jgi:cobalamin-dependent methionine synthase I
MTPFKEKLSIEDSRGMSEQNAQCSCRGYDNYLGLPFLNVGERLRNTYGSIRKVMMAGDNRTAMNIAKTQIEDVAHVIDINEDDGLLDGLANAEFVM